MAIKLSEKLGDPKWIRMSERIAQLMKEKKNLNANVDFYSATVYYSLGIPTDLFTPIFAIARCSGWCAHVLEQLEDNRLYRPLSEYVGEPVGQKGRADRRAKVTRSRDGNTRDALSSISRSGSASSGNLSLRFGRQPGCGRVSVGD